VIKKRKMNDLHLYLKRTLMPRKKKSETTSVKAAPKAKRASTSKTPKAKTTKAKKAAPKAVKETSPKKTTAKLSAAQSVSAKTEAATSWKKPRRQGETQMVAFIRDPHCIFTYWEVTPESIESVKKQLMEEYKSSTMVLRVFRAGSDGQAELLQEIRVEPGEMNRYVELKENTGSYFIEIAQKTASGKTVVYARSNRIITGPSAEPESRRGGSESSRWETPAGLLEYFSDAEEVEIKTVTGGISSAEAHRRELARRKLDRYSASRMG
jgi:hypothetical protein